MGISRSTYYEPPNAAPDDTAIVEAIAAICDEFEFYGWRRVLAELTAPLDQGFSCGSANISGAVMSSACRCGFFAAGPDGSSAWLFASITEARSIGAERISGFRAFPWFTSLLGHPRFRLASRRKSFAQRQALTGWPA